MDEKKGNAGAAGEQEFVISRIFDAPRELVFKAFSEAERLAQWWGPKGMTMTVAKLDFRPGGIFHYGMKMPQGQEMWGKFVYREIVPPERIVFVVSFTDENANPVRHPYCATWPLEVLSTVTFEAQGSQTELTMRGYPINASDVEIKTYVEGRKSMEAGFAGTWSQLEEYLQKAQGC